VTKDGILGELNFGKFLVILRSVIIIYYRS